MWTSLYVHTTRRDYARVECKKAQPKEVMLPANLAKTRAAGRGAYDFMWSLGALPDGFPAAYAAYAAGRSYSGYPSFGLPYPAGNPLASLHHQLSGNHYHHLATLLPYHPLELSGVYNVHAMHL
ncbi:unnamed protein product [Pieris macdunnoughi]|uniref:Uncharacterized protein n=3 Tax=Obtectomera TaxID=104431 RepID=A0A821MUH9_9NEOP|nr:unnamed protein product [Pieris macdunnoughi]